MRGNGAIIRARAAGLALCALLSAQADPVLAESARPRTPKTAIVEFVSAPFPYDDVIPGTGKPFFDVIEQERRGRRSVGGRVYWENETYRDQCALLHIPAHFDVRRPGVIVVFFHGHGAILERDVRDRQRLPAQISQSKANAVLVAPQFAVDAADSSAGNFWEPGSFARYMREAARRLAELHGDRRSERAFAAMPVVIVAYSGGYLPAAWVLHEGGLGNRIVGVVLLDALYGEIDKFENWIASNRSGFFLSAYLPPTRARNLELQRLLSERAIPYATSLTGNLRAGTVAFLSGSVEDKHQDFVTQAWTTNPVTDLLDRIVDLRR